jgi:hypothetical protein
MFDLLFETMRKASESSLQMPQDMFKYWTQQWMSAPQNTAGPSMEWTRNFQKRWLDLAVDSMNKHREMLDSTYKAGIQLIEQTFRVTEAKSSEDYRKIVEELWHKLLDIFKEQADSQFREFQKWSEKSFDIQKSATA